MNDPTERTMVRDRGDRLTPDLLSWEPAPVAVGYPPDVAGRGELGNQIARLVSRALRDARDERGLTRAVIARQMGDELGRQVSEGMLDKWSSEASEEHRIPLDAFVALVRVTDGFQLLGFIPGLFGFAVVHRKYEAIIELALVEEHERELAAYKARAMAKVRAAR